jgi:hypothetical protein
VVRQRRAQFIDADRDVLVDIDVLQSFLVREQHVPQLGDRQRFLDAAEHVQAVGAGHGLHGIDQRRVERAHQGDPARQLSLRDVADELDAVHAWHVEVDQDDVRRLPQAFEHGQRFRALGRFVHVGDGQFCQQAQCHPALEAVVLDHHDVQRGQGHSISPDGSLLRTASLTPAPLPGDSRRAMGNPGPGWGRCYNLYPFLPIADAPALPMCVGCAAPGVTPAGPP